MKLRRLLLSSLTLCLWAQGQARGGPPVAAVGDCVPDCELTDQDGKICHIRQFKGQALAFTFIFTRCPLVAYCPRMTERFLEVRHELAADQAATDWHLLSLSFDPEHDTPAQLCAYAKARHIETTGWTFATGAEGVVRTFGATFGLTAVMEEGLLNHNLRTVVVDRGGHVQHIFKGNEWTAKDLVWELRKALAR